MRNGSLTIGLGVVVLLAGAAVIVFALSTQSGANRSMLAAICERRYCGHLAESSVAEALADLTRDLSTRLHGAGARALLASAPGPRVPATALAGIFGDSRWTYVAQRTIRELATRGLHHEVAPVRVELLYYDTATNYGEVKLEGSASWVSSSGRRLEQRVVSRHYLVLHASGNFLLVNPIAIQSISDQGALP